MKMTKLFTTVFDEEMKARGFKRKAKLYYRLNGEILQGVIIKTINPYSIHFYAAPYWMRNLCDDMPLNKGYWADFGLNISPGGEAYYREENERLNLDYMNICFSLAKEHFLPVLDKITDLDSYLENCTPNWDKFGDHKNERVIKILPGSIDPKYSYLNYPITILWDIWCELYQHYAFLNYGYRENDLQKGLDLLDEKDALLSEYINRDRFAQERYITFMTKDGLDKAKEYFTTRRAEMLPRLREELGLDTFNL